MCSWYIPLISSSAGLSSFVVYYNAIIFHVSLLLAVEVVKSSWIFPFYLKVPEWWVHMSLNSGHGPKTQHKGNWKSLHTETPVASLCIYADSIRSLHTNCPHNCWSYITIELYGNVKVNSHLMTYKPWQRYTSTVISMKKLNQTSYLDMSQYFPYALPNFGDMLWMRW